MVCAGTIHGNKNISLPIRASVAKYSVSDVIIFTGKNVLIYNLLSNVKFKYSDF